MAATPGARDEMLEVGQQFARAVTGRDFDALQTTFHPRVRARLLITPGLITPVDLHGLLGKFQQWFAAATEYEVQRMEVDCVGQRLSIAYRVLLQDEDGWSILEQHAYGSVEQGQIIQFDLLCSGFEPYPPAER